jgi:hypothetical protein
VSVPFPHLIFRHTTPKTRTPRNSHLLLTLNGKANRAFVHTLQSDWLHILVDLVKGVLEAFDIVFSHQGLEFDDTGDGNADANFQGGPEEDRCCVDCLMLLVSFCEFGGGGAEQECLTELVL